jgi:hypothetical protein
MKISVAVAKPEDSNRVSDLLRQMGYAVSESDTAKRIKEYEQLLKQKK